MESKIDYTEDAEHCYQGKEGQEKGGGKNE